MKRLYTLVMLVVASLHPRAEAAIAQVPDWVRSQAEVVLPVYDKDTAAVLLYSETILAVRGPGKADRIDRRVYKILKREGEAFGMVRADFDAQSPVRSIRAWSLPAQGKAYEVGDREAIESAFTGVEGGELITDVRMRVLRIPAATVGSIVAYEITQEQRPYVMVYDWGFQETVPVREARYTLRMPKGWSHRAFWINHAEQAPQTSERGELQWTLSDLEPVALEARMPPWHGIAGRLVLSLMPPDGVRAGFQSWHEVGTWYLDLTRGRRDASPEIAQKVRELTASAPTSWEKAKVLAAYVQKEVRYVAIELGIGGVQPHPAAEVFGHRYGDCKDKVTLLSSMLKEIGIDSHYMILNTRRGAVTATTPPNFGFNHAIIAISMPAGVETGAMPALTEHGKLGKVLYFDPTHTLIPFGRLPGELQAGYGMLVTPDGGELQQLPQAAPDANGVQRTAKLVLDENGTLTGDVVETWSGDMAALQRGTLLAATQDTDHIKPVESMLSHSLGAFAIVKASMVNARVLDKPLEWRYSLEAERYSKAAGDVLLIRPRVFGSFSSSLLADDDKPRKQAIEFDALARNSDVFEITLPAGYVAEDLPAPMNEDIGYATYQSRTEVKGNVLRYARTLEIKKLSVPAADAAKLKMFYDRIFADERASAVLGRKAL
jgi:transglutaminase-like putative cysteine protease